MHDPEPLKVMADYGCFPLWGNLEYGNFDSHGNIDPHSLPISENLQSGLMTWAGKYDAILNLDDPASTDFASPEDREAFILEGKELAERLQRELGDAYKIEYPNVY